MTIEDYKNLLKEYLLLCFHSWKPDTDEEIMKSFDLGLFPWNGMLELSFLTQQEYQEETENFEFDIASWKYYDFARSEHEFIEDTKYICQWCKDYYLQDESNKRDRAIEIFMNSAEVLADPELQSALHDNFSLTDDFKITVYDPDDPGFKNFYNNP